MLVRQRVLVIRSRFSTTGCTFTSNASPVLMPSSEPIGVWPMAFSPMNCAFPRASFM
jgi:hypothetical protein